MRTAIIGLGVIGNVHAQTLASQGKSIVALCDVDLSAAEKARAAYAPNAAVFSDWREMLAVAKPDTVHVCTPHYLHAEMTVHLLRHGIHVLCEKPLCMKEEELALILEAEKSSPAMLGVCHQNRFLPTNIYIKELLSDKKIAAAHGSVVWKRTKEYYDSAAWRGTLAYEGGGVLINQALHTLDLMTWFCGDPTHVTALAHNLTLGGEIEVEDTVSAVFFGENRFTFFATNASGGDMPVEARFLLESGERITLTPSDVTVNGTVLLHDEIEKVLGKPCYGSGHEMLIADFYDCLATGRHFPIDGAEGARVMRLIFGVYRSKGEQTEL